MCSSPGRVVLKLFALSQICGGYPHRRTPPTQLGRAVLGVAHAPIARRPPQGPLLAFALLPSREYYPPAYFPTTHATPVPQSVPGIYRLVAMANWTDALLSTAPGSLNSQAAKAVFYVLHILPEWVAATTLLCVNVKQMFGFKNWQS